MSKPAIYLSAFITAAFLAISIPAISNPAPQAATPAPIYPVMQNPIKPTAAGQADAKRIYTQDCAMCHGATGDAKTDMAPIVKLTQDWTDPNTLAAKPDGELFTVIRNGSGMMPAESTPRASDTQVWNLVLYIRSFSKH
jgi:cytochrome c5